MAPRSHLDDAQIILTNQLQQDILTHTLQIKRAHLALCGKRFLNRCGNIPQAGQSLLHQLGHALSHPTHNGNAGRGDDEITQQHGAFMMGAGRIHQIRNRCKQSQGLNHQIIHDGNHALLHHLGKLNDASHQISSRRAVVKRERQPLQPGKDICPQVTHCPHAGLGQQIGIAVCGDSAHQHYQGDEPGGTPEHHGLHILCLHPGLEKILHQLRHLGLAKHNREHILNHERQSETGGSSRQNPRQYPPGNQKPLGKHVPHQKRFIN